MLRLLLVLGLIAGALAAYGRYWWTDLRGTVGTDDAYVDARIVSAAARLSGRVETVDVLEGMKVRKGQQLATLAKDKLQIQLSQAHAEVMNLEARLNELLKGPRSEEIAVARAGLKVLEVELARRERELKRIIKLANNRLISGESLDNRRADVAAINSQLEVQRKKLQLISVATLPEVLEQARAQVLQSKSRVKAIESDLRDTVLFSPVEGMVAKRMVEAGEVVANGQALFQIVALGKTWVVANLEENQISRVEIGQAVQIWIDAYPNRIFQGRVGPLYAATLSRFSLLSTSSASGNFIKVTQRIPVRIDWLEDEMPPLYPGLNVEIRIQVGIQ